MTDGDILALATLQCLVPRLKKDYSVSKVNLVYPCCNYNKVITIGVNPGTRGNVPLILFDDGDTISNVPYM